MEINLMLLADYASVDKDNKLNVMGIFDTVYADTFPTSVSDMGIVFSGEAPADEKGLRKKLEIELTGGSDSNLREAGNIGY